MHAIEFIFDVLDTGITMSIANDIRRHDKANCPNWADNFIVGIMHSH